MKKILIAIAVLAAITCVAAPYHHPAGHRASIVHRGSPPRHAPMSHHHHHHSVWGRGRSHFWPGFTGGLVGSLLAPVVVPPPHPPRPIVYVQQTWVPPVYETRPIYDSYGRIIRYEQVIVVPGYWR